MTQLVAHTRVSSAAAASRLAEEGVDRRTSEMRRRTKATKNLKKSASGLMWRRKGVGGLTLEKSGSLKNLKEFCPEKGWTNSPNGIKIAR